MLGLYLGTVFGILLLLIICYIYVFRLAKKTMYSYRLMAVIGLTIFLIVSLVIRTLEFCDYDFSTISFTSYYNELLRMFADFALFSFPIMVVLAIVVYTGNLVMYIRWGRSMLNVVGMVSGAIILLATIASFGLLNFVYYAMDEMSPFWYHFAIFGVNIFYIALSYYECMMMASFICTIKSARHVPAKNKDYLVILGCYAGDGKKLPPILKGRVDVALKFAKMQQKEANKGLIFVPSGGKGSDEAMSEAEAMANYLEKRKVSHEMILLEDRSENTRQNMLFSKKLIGDKKVRVAFATTGCHVFRSGVIASRVGLHAEGMGSKTKWFFYVNEAMREYVANISNEKKMHLFNLAMLNLSMLILVLISYFNSII